MSAMKLAATMKLNARGFMNPLGKVRGMLGGTIGRLAMMTGGMASLAGVSAGLRKSLSFAADLDHLSKRVGATAGNLAILNQAFDDTGVGASSTGELLNYMQRNLNMVDKAGKTSNKGLKALGINLSDLAGLGTVEKFESIGQKIMEIDDPAKRTAVSMDVFGRSGAKALQYFGAGGAFDAAAGSLGSLPGLLDANSAKFESIDTYMGRLKMKWTGLFTGIMSGMAPQIDGVMAKVDKVDFADWGVKISNAGKIAHATFANGRLGEVAGLGLKLGFRTALNALFGPLSSGSTWKGLGQVALAGLAGFGAGLLKMFMLPLTYLQAGFDKLMGEIFEKLGKIPKLGKVMGLEGYEAKSFSEHLQGRKDNGFFLRTAAEQSSRSAGAMMNKGLGSLRAGRAAASDMFGAGDVRAQLSGVMTEIREGMAEAAPAVRDAVASMATTTAANIQAPEIGGKAGSPASALTDQLSRIGGFLGGSSPQTRLAQEGNRLLKRINQGIDDLAESNGGTFVPAWGN